ncbi:hypothetical protein [Geomonas propionica]|uniref:Uncharacterized protein n=1 Tax=Geomonas propionica TaxID=2798582 RepID=A0ABS0YLN8_9BACT|nr:hypothetical protein [Geomonas propionica]MBJ6798816.1 hypothetical protein [Geomonas propionica]
MISIYGENYPGETKPADGPRLTLMTEWIETNVRNLRASLLFMEHAPTLLPVTGGELVLEIDGVVIDSGLLPKCGADHLKRCGRWLNDVQRIRAISTVPRPVFGL